MWSNTPLNELDLTKSEKGGPSYRHLPKNFPLLSCSEVNVHTVVVVVVDPAVVTLLAVYGVSRVFACAPGVWESAAGAHVSRLVKGQRMNNRLYARTHARVQKRYTGVMLVAADL